jgi:hypothetical protein
MGTRILAELPVTAAAAVSGPPPAVPSGCVSPAGPGRSAVDTAEGRRWAWKRADKTRRAARDDGQRITLPVTIRGQGLGGRCSPDPRRSAQPAVGPGPPIRAVPGTVRAGPHAGQRATMIATAVGHRCSPRAAAAASSFTGRRAGFRPVATLHDDPASREPRSSFPGDVPSAMCAARWAIRSAREGLPGLERPGQPGCGRTGRTLAAGCRAV